MAGMLPGVESARRRGFRQNGGRSHFPSAAAHGSTRRSSFCLYASNHESRPCCTSYSMVKHERTILKEAYVDEKLGGVARAAKERLDERLRARQRKSETRRNYSHEGRAMIGRDLLVELFVSKKSGSRFSWAKLGSKVRQYANHGSKTDC